VTDTVRDVLTNTLKRPARGPGRTRQLVGHDQDFRKGAVEVDEPDTAEHGSRNALALGADGLPADQAAIAEARFGANIDDHEVSQAGETGQSADTLRDEELEIERHGTRTSR
jgi:hypothetical protein